MTEQFSIYTDGSCTSNPGPCGCGAVIIDKDDNIIWTLSEYIGQGTNNIGELTAILRALQRIKEINANAEINLYTDSEVCIKILNKRSSKVEHLQKILEKCLIEAEGLNIQFNWIKGHAAHKWNEFADKLATSAVSFNTKQNETKQPNDILELNCSFAEKEQVKELGATWNRFKKRWIVKDTENNRQLFQKWI